MIDFDKVSREDRYLLNSFGEDVLNFIARDDVTEVYVNEDYYVWIDTTTGCKRTDVLLTEDRVTSICEGIAGLNKDIISEQSPMLGVELVTLQIRSQIVYPPICRRPIFHLRKKPSIIFSLEEYREQGILSPKYYDTLVDLVKERKNVIIIGATGSGKTTFINALLKKLAEVTPDHRLLLLEDLPELQSSSLNVQRLVTSGNKSTRVTMEDLVFVAMRLSPNRIIVGEVRNGCAYDMLKAWNTGHEGGFSTIHANSCENAFLRLEGLVCESPQVYSPETARFIIGESVDAVVSIQKHVSETGTKRLIDDIILVNGYDRKRDEFMFTHV